MASLYVRRYSGFVIARLRPELADWLKSQYLADPSVSFGSLRDLVDRWRGPASPVTGLVPEVQQHSEQLHSLLATAPSPSAVAPSLMRPTLLREAQIPLGPLQPLRSLVAYFRIDVRGLAPGSVDGFVTQLAGLTAVLDQAQREPGLAPPSPRVDWEDDLENDRPATGAWLQLHTEGGGIGINCSAEQVWEAGYDGSGVGFVDIELGWDLKHPDLPAPKFDSGTTRTPFHNLNDAVFEWHGTPVLGIVVGMDNTEGIVGIAPQADFLGVASYKASSDPADITNAILESITRMHTGDVLLLEVQTTGGSAFPGVQINLPVEVVDLWFDAIRHAVGCGMIVIEPAGNGNGVTGWDLDDEAALAAAGVTRSLKRVSWPSASQHLLDSGAIMVSACYADLESDGTHVRLVDVNYGSRIDCFAWGEEVHTTTPGDYGPFTATSAASAIVAGAAILVQQMWRSTHLTSASAGQIRALLSAKEFGTPVVHTAAGLPAGVMPDLALIATMIGAAPDVFVRDRVGDDGAVPNANTSQSPDIIVRKAAFANPAASIGEGSGKEEQMPAFDAVVPDAPNYLYVRMRNRNTADAANVVARVYWADAGTLIVPTDWHFIGESQPMTVPGAPGGAAHGPLVVTDPPIVWTPASGALPAQMPTQHGCFIALLSCAADPAPPAIIAAAGPNGSPTTWAQFLDFIGRNNNAAWRNFNVIGVAGPGPGAALWAEAAFNVNGAAEAVAFDFEVLQQFPPGVVARLELGRELAPRLARAVRANQRREKDESEEIEEGYLTIRHDSRLALAGLQLAPKARYEAHLRIDIDPRVQPEPVTIALRQLYRGLEVGRVTFVVDQPSWKRARR